MARAGVSQRIAEALGSYPGSGEVSQYVVEVLLPTGTFSPTTVTGAGVSQAVVEVLASINGKARASQCVIEVLMSVDGALLGGGGVRVFGYAG